MDFKGKQLDYFVSGWGTGGTISGVSSVLKIARPDCKIVCVEPVKAQVIENGPKGFNSHAIQGWTPDFVPETLNTECFDVLTTVTDEESISTSKLLAKEEGILCGISGGATLAAAINVAKKAPKGSVILAMLPDTGERYLSTVLFGDITADSDVI